MIHGEVGAGKVRRRCYTTTSGLPLLYQNFIPYAWVVLLNSQLSSAHSDVAAEGAAGRTSGDVRRHPLQPEHRLRAAVALGLLELAQTEHTLRARVRRREILPGTEGLRARPGEYLLL